MQAFRPRRFATYPYSDLLCRQHVRFFDGTGTRKTATAQRQLPAHATKPNDHTLDRTLSGGVQGKVGTRFTRVFERPRVHWTQSSILLCAAPNATRCRFDSRWSSTVVLLHGGRRDAAQRLLINSCGVCWRRCLWCSGPTFGRPHKYHRSQGERRHSFSRPLCWHH